jgi:hypothetical protein
MYRGCNFELPPDRKDDDGNEHWRLVVLRENDKTFDVEVFDCVESNFDDIDTLVTYTSLSKLTFDEYTDALEEYVFLFNELMQGEINGYHRNSWRWRNLGLPRQLFCLFSRR